MNTLSEKEFSRPGDDYMIEETKKTCTDCIHYEICSLWTTRDLDEDEAYKYCFGRYRPKIPENAVMLTEKEYGELYQRMFDEVRQANDLKVEQARRETVEKFAEMLKSDVSEDNELHEALNKYLKRDYIEYIDRRCKELMEGK
jgi:hypothetical protein